MRKGVRNQEFGGCLFWVLQNKLCVFAGAGTELKHLADFVHQIHSQGIGKLMAEGYSVLVKVGSAESHFQVTGLSGDIHPEL